MAPDISTVAGHIEGKISEDLHRKLIGKLAQPHPLTAQMPLQQLLLKKTILMRFTPLS
ncbi:MAG: Uncharacterised protein [Cyanobium sp. ARS6]|nr:MAG: Uncharacterised protein [Cyanobium sp. ARS6]